LRVGAIGGDLRGRCHVPRITRRQAAGGGAKGQVDWNE
jgi:hypothetical protein